MVPGSQRRLGRLSGWRGDGNAFPGGLGISSITATRRRRRGSKPALVPETLRRQPSTGATSARRRQRRRRNSITTPPKPTIPTVAGAGTGAVAPSNSSARTPLATLAPWFWMHSSV